MPMPRPDICCALGAPAAKTWHLLIPPPASPTHPFAPSLCMCGLYFSSYSCLQLPEYSSPPSHHPGGELTHSSPNTHKGSINSCFLKGRGQGTRKFRAGQGRCPTVLMATRAATVPGQAPLSLTFFIQVLTRSPFPRMLPISD